jgi:polyhydroxyalkanoate synthesis regulator phasin
MAGHAEGREGTLRGLAEELLLAGVGAVALTRERAGEIVDDLVRRGRISREDAEGLTDELAGVSRGDGRRLSERAAAALAGVFRDLGLVTEREHDALELRVAQLEHRVRLLEKRESEAAGE